ncbi:MAG: hypothetical protein U9N86_17960 [Bacteroidota bacterium]|nr:hypothetical protein [Bacteroidota bacterium]
MLYLHRFYGQLAQLVQSIPTWSGGSMDQTEFFTYRAISSAGSEHPDLVGRVNGSNRVLYIPGD